MRGKPIHRLPNAMASLNILHYPDERLHKVAQPVDKVDDRIRKLVADMAETMYAAPGIGLAATQVDVHERVKAELGENALVLKGDVRSIGDMRASACVSTRLRWPRSKQEIPAASRSGQKGLWAVVRAVRRATGYQRPLVGVSQSGKPLIQANADGEPEKVLQW